MAREDIRFESSQSTYTHDSWKLAKLNHLRRKIFLHVINDTKYDVLITHQLILSSDTIIFTVNPDVLFSHLAFGTKTPDVNLLATLT